MTSSPNSNPSVSFVLASETQPDEAMQIHAAVKKFAPGAALRALPEQKWLYGEKFGFQYAELDSGEPVQAALRQMLNARNARLASLAPGSLVLRYDEPLGFVLIVFSIVGSGLLKEMSKDLWTGIKKVVKWLWNQSRRKDEQPSELARLFGEVAGLYNPETSWNPVALLQIPQVRLTFVVEPQLPEEAVRKAERLVLLGPRRNFVDMPLRWHRDQKRWLPIRNAILSEEAFKDLRNDINTRLREQKVLAYTPRRRLYFALVLILVAIVIFVVVYLVLHGPTK